MQELGFALLVCHEQNVLLFTLMVMVFFCFVFVLEFDCIIIFLVRQISACANNFSRERKYTCIYVDRKLIRQICCHIVFNFLHSEVLR